MPRTCTICAHPDREAIDAALMAGASLRDISGQYRLSKSAIDRHKTEHLPDAMVKAQEQADVDHGIDLMQQLRDANQMAWKIARDAQTAGDGDLALKALDRVVKQLDLVAELTEQLDRRPVVNILAAPEWIRVRSALVDVLAGWPDARSAVSARLLALESANARN